MFRQSGGNSAPSPGEDSMSRLTPGRRRAVRAAAISFAATAVAVFAFAGPAAAATGTVHTDSGASLTVRSGPHTSSSAVGSVADGATINITCQTHGDTVTGKY